MSDSENTNTSSTPQKDSGAAAATAISKRRSGYWCNQFFCELGWTVSSDECRLLTRYVCEHLLPFHCPQAAEEAALIAIKKLTAPGALWYGVPVKYIGAHHYK